MKPVQINHDAFARQSVIRVPDNSKHATCDWCGGTRARGGVFRYGVETDDGRRHWDSHRFCGLDCRNIYYEG
jgi:hypothetical protein